MRKDVVDDTANLMMHLHDHPDGVVGEIVRRMVREALVCLSPEEHTVAAVVGRRRWERAAR